MSITGGCQCGAVRYALHAPHVEKPHVCHCRMCQLAFGNTRAAFINVPQSAVRWLSEPPKLYASSTFARRGFCPDCGTPLSFAYGDSQKMDLSVGSLDDPARIRPTSHFAVESRVANWHAEDGLPGHRLDASEKLAARWKAAYGDDVVPGVEAVRKV